MSRSIPAGDKQTEAAYPAAAACFCTLDGEAGKAAYGSNIPGGKNQGVPGPEKQVGRGEARAEAGGGQIFLRLGMCVCAGIGVGGVTGMRRKREKTEASRGRGAGEWFTAD